MSGLYFVTRRNFYKEREEDGTSSTISYKSEVCHYIFDMYSTQLDEFLKKEFAKSKAPNLEITSIYIDDSTGEIYGVVPVNWRAHPLKKSGEEERLQDGV